MNGARIRRSSSGCNGEQQIREASERKREQRIPFYGPRSRRVSIVRPTKKDLSIQASQPILSSRTLSHLEARGEKREARDAAAAAAA